MDQIQDILDIKKGKSLKEFDDVTAIKAFAAMNTRDAWDELPEQLKNRRFAKMAVMQNFRNLNKVGEKYIPHCSGVFATWNKKLARKDLNAYMQILNAQSPAFIKSALRFDPSILRLIQNKTKRAKDQEDHEVNLQQRALHIIHSNSKTQKNPRLDIDDRDLAFYDFTGTEYGNINELGPEAYLARPVSLQTKEDLESLLQLPDKFPPDFIERLLIPYRQEALCRQAHDDQKADEWKTRQIPWLDKDICSHIAQMHPEASIKTPGYLTKDIIAEYWNWCKDNEIEKDVLTEYFIAFPSEMLNESMCTDITVDWKVLAHAPQFFAGSETARKYLNQHPNDVFKLPKEYQTITKILADGTSLNKENIQQIKDTELRELIAAAAGIEIEE